MSTLAQLEARLAARLVDAGNAVFATATLDEALRAALSDYTAAAPLTMETVLVLPGDGREIALSGVDGLTGVTDVWWPFDPGSEIWPPNRVRGFRLWWDDAQPVLFLESAAGGAPREGDALRLWYTRAHTIESLDAGALTTLPAHHESGLVTGAAGYAAVSENIDQIGALHLDLTETDELRRWGSARLAEFERFLGALRAAAPAPGPAFGAGWVLDAYADQP
jgi:hypothetical protein